MRWGVHTRRVTLGALLLAVVWTVAGCQENGDIRVTSIAFDGNDAVTDSQLLGILATKASGWLPWARKQYFNRQEFENDLARIRRYYADRGYPDAKISRVDVNLNERRTAVAVRIEVVEGAPTLVEAVDFHGFEVLDERVRSQLASLPLQAGSPRDREKVVATRQQARELLLNNGYAYADVTSSDTPGASARAVVVAFTATPGPATTFGPITISGEERVSERVIRRELSFREGDVYRNSRVVDSQRRLAGVDILRFVNVDARPPEGQRPLAVPVEITVSENLPRQLELGAGYGSEDRVRGSAEWSHLSFFGNARRVSANAKWSSIDRGLRLSLLQPYLYRRGLSLDLSGSTWWTYERTYGSHVYGGRAGVTYRFPSGGRGPVSRRPADTLKAAYVRESLDYQITPEALDDLTGFDQLIALGLDPITGSGKGTKAAIALGYERSVVDDPINPRRGYAASVSVEYARPALGGTFRYDEILGEMRVYVPVSDRFVLAGRGRAGTIRAETDADVPFSERYFLGGSTSLRGWGRYQVAPLADGLPVGGRTIVDLSLEVRASITGPFGAVAFVDTGNVWAGDLAANVSRLRSSAGAGLRYATPIGLARADLGFQLNPIDGLLINGVPESRHWRLHFSIGHAF